MIEIEQSQTSITAAVIADLQPRIKRGLDKAAIMAVRNIKQSFRNPPDQQPRSGLDLWPPTAIAAKVHRKTYPVGVDKTTRERWLARARTLNDTGKLMESVAKVGETYNEQEWSVEVGSLDSPDKVRLHHKGGSFKGKVVPMRRFLEINNVEKEMVTQFVEEQFK